MNSNPVVEVFGELFEKLKDRSAEKAQPNVGSFFKPEWFDQALGLVNYTPFGYKKAPGDTIPYDVNNPATWANFLPPEFLEAELPATTKRRKGKK